MEIEDIRSQLLAREIHRSMGTMVDTATEEQLLKEKELLAVLPQNNLQNVVKLLRDDCRNTFHHLGERRLICQLSDKTGSLVTAPDQPFATLYDVT